MNCNEEKSQLVDDIIKMRGLMFEQSPAMMSLSASMADAAPEFIEWIKTWDHHDWLGFISITSGILGSIPSPASGALLSISLGTGALDAYYYFKEDDPYTGGLILAFSIIPAGQLIRLANKVGMKTFLGLGRKKSVELLEKAASGTANATERKTAENIVKESAKAADELAKLTMMATINNIIAELGKKSLNFVLKFLILLYRLNIYTLKAGIIIAGTFYSYDTLYKALNYKNIKNLDVRERNSLVQLHNLIVGDEKKINEMLIQNLKEPNVLDSILKNPQPLINMDTTVPIIFVDNKNKLKDK
jgi:hypothetical protein